VRSIWYNLPVWRLDKSIDNPNSLFSNGLFLLRHIAEIDTTLRKALKPLPGYHLPELEK
tara:strand:+ start:543 stop:719 length:177 start_codon:yes stop_codon:yes gene_type:complete